MPQHATAPSTKTKPGLTKHNKANLDNPIICGIVLALLTIIAYANSLHGKLVFDDQQIVMQNPQLMNIRSLMDVISVGAGWRQLLFLTYGLNYYWGGLDTFSYHAVNLALHTVNVLLIYAIILAILRDETWARFAALAGASVFAVHTMFSSAVSYIAGRSSVLCGTFYFAAILLFFKGLNAPGRRGRILFFAGTAVAGLLAWQAKQEAITLPLFLAAVLFLRMEKKAWKRMTALAAVPVIVLFVVRDQMKALYSTVGGNQILVSAGFENVLPAAAYFRTYLSSIVGYYFPRFVVPLGLSADPQITPVEHWYSAEFLVSIAALAALSWVALQLYKREPLFALGVTALLVSPLMAYAAIPLADVVLEHRAYIPGLGVALVFAWAFSWLARNYSTFRWAAFGLVLAIFTVMTISRNPVFANNITLWEDAESKAPGKPRPHFNLGQSYQNAQRLPEAIREYQHALALKPDIHAAYSNMAAIYLDMKEIDKAEQTLLKVTSLAPDFSEGFINLAVLYIRKQETEKALAAVNRALEINPDSFAAHFNKGEALSQHGEYKTALESYKQAVHLRPDLDSFRLTLAIAYSRAGDRPEAERQLIELTKGPVAAEAFRNLGVLYNDSGQSDQAIQYFQHAISLKPVYPQVHHDLGIVYLRRQMPNEAIEQFQATLQQQPDHGPAVLNLAMAYQMKGDVAAAKKALEGFLQQYGNSNAGYVVQVRQRLATLP